MWSKALPVLLTPNAGNLPKRQSNCLAGVAFEVSVALGVEQKKKTLCLDRFS